MKKQLSTNLNPFNGVFNVYTKRNSNANNNNNFKLSGIMHSY